MAADGRASARVPHVRRRRVTPLVRISPIARRDIVRLAKESVDGRETGGILLGFDATGSMPQTVTVAGDAGSHAERSPVRFRRDLAHAQALARDAWLLDRSLWIGDWHTHPMGWPHPSGVDLGSYRRVLSTGAMSVFLSIIVSPTAHGGWDEPEVATWIVTPTAVRPADLTTDRPKIVVPGS